MMFPRASSKRISHLEISIKRLQIDSEWKQSYFTICNQ